MLFSNSCTYSSFFVSLSRGKNQQAFAHVAVVREIKSHAQSHAQRFHPHMKKKWNSLTLRPSSRSLINVPPPIWLHNYPRFVRPPPLPPFPRAFVLSILGMHLFGCKFCPVADRLKSPPGKNCPRMNFDSLPRALLTVFQVVVVGGAGWRQVARHGAGWRFLAPNDAAQRGAM